MNMSEWYALGMNDRVTIGRAVHNLKSDRTPYYKSQAGPAVALLLCTLCYNWLISVLVPEEESSDTVWM